MNILLTGASGLIGSALKPHLEAAGHSVACLRRVRKEAEPFWNLAAGVIDLGACPAPDAVIHLAGENVATGRWTAAKKKRLRSSRLIGTDLLARHLAQITPKPGAFLCASAIGFYGDRGQEALDETSLPGDGFLATLGLEWEAAAQPAVEAGIRTVWLRSGIVLAPQGGALANMLPPFRLGLGGRLGHGKQLLSWISLADELEAIRFLLEHPKLKGPFNLTAPEPVSNRIFTQQLAEALRRPARFPAPAGLLRLLLGEMADELLLASTCVKPKKLLNAGFKFCHPDLRSALDWALNPRT